MLAIVRPYQPSPSRNQLFQQLLTPSATVLHTSLKEEPVKIFTFNPLYRRRFPKLVSKIRKDFTRIYFTEEMKIYPNLCHEISQGACFFRHLPAILSQMAPQDVSDVGILCEHEDPRLIPLAELLSQFSPSVSIVTEKDSFFERVSQNLLRSHGLSLNQKSPSDIRIKRLLILLNTSDRNCCSHGEFLIDLNDTPNLSHKNLLWDISTEEVCQFFRDFHITGLKHCHFVPMSEGKLKLIWKISKKS